MTSGEHFRCVVPLFFIKGHLMILAASGVTGGFSQGGQT